jgi:hypothetical protein
MASIERRAKAARDEQARELNDISRAVSPTSKAVA